MNDADAFLKSTVIAGMGSQVQSLMKEIWDNKHVNRTVTLEATRNFLESLARHCETLASEIDTELYTPVRSADDDIPF